MTALILFTSRTKRLSLLAARAVTDFRVELKKFCQANWWIFLIYTGLMAILYNKADDAIPEVFTITSVHFVSDIFILMMLSAYARRDFTGGTWYQLIAMLLFATLKIYTGVADDMWHFLAGDILYILAACNNYKREVGPIPVPSISPAFILVLGAVILWSFAFETDMRPPMILQTAGIYLYAVALGITDDEPKRYILSIIALTVMIAGSGLEYFIDLLANSMKGETVTAINLSYTVLPMTVLLFYVQRWRKFIPRRPLLGI